MQPQPPVVAPPPPSAKPSAAPRARQYFSESVSPPSTSHQVVASRSASSERSVSPPPPVEAVATSRRKVGGARFAGIRRKSSFTRYNTIPQQADAWFRGNSKLHAELLKFIETASKGSSASKYHELFMPSYFAYEFFKTPQLQLTAKPCGPPAPAAPAQLQPGVALSFSLGVRGQKDVSVVSVAHETQALFVSFCDMFERQLEGNFLPNVRASSSTTAGTSSSVTTPEQFMATMQLHAAEEETDGTHFDRWLEITELDVFIEYCRAYYTYITYFTPTSTSTTAPEDHPVTAFLLHVVDDISLEARFQHFKRSLLEPMLIQWSPLSFNESVAPALDAFLNFTKQKQIKKMRLKQLLRWKLVLSTKVLGAGGVMVHQPLDGDACTRYLMMFCDAYGVKVDTPGGSDDDETSTATQQDMIPATSHTVRGLVRFLLKWADEDEAKRPAKSTHAESLTLANRHVKRAVWEIFSGLKRAEATMITTKQPAAFASSISLDLLLASIAQMFQFWFLLDEPTRTLFNETAGSRRTVAGNGLANAAMFALVTASTSVSQVTSANSEWIKSCPSDVIPVPQPWKVGKTTDVPASLVSHPDDLADLHTLFNMPSKAQQKLRLRATNYLKSEGCSMVGSSWRVDTLEQLHYLIFEVVLVGRGIVGSLDGPPNAPDVVLDRIGCLQSHVFPSLDQPIISVNGPTTEIATVVSVASLLARFVQQKQQSQLRLRQLNLI